MNHALLVLLFLVLLVQSCVYLTSAEQQQLVTLEALEAEEAEAKTEENALYREPNLSPARAPVRLPLIPTVRELRAGGGGRTSPSTYAPTRPSFYCASLTFGVNDTETSKCSVCVNSGCVWCSSGDYCFSGSSSCSNYVSGTSGVCRKLSIGAAVAIIIVSVIIPILCCCGFGAAIFYYFYAYADSKRVGVAVNQNFGNNVGQPQQGVQMGAYNQVPQQQFAYAQPIPMQAQSYPAQAYPAQAQAYPPQAYPPQAYPQQPQAYPQQQAYGQPQAYGQR